MKPDRKIFFIAGLLAGLLLPFVTFRVIHAYRFEHYAFAEFVRKLLTLEIAGKFMSLAAIPNLLLFFGFNWLNKLNAARGVIAATFIITLAILIIKII